MVVLVSFFVLATGASGQVDTGTDGIGIYFDQGATLVSTTAPAGTEWIPAYLVLTHPSVEGNLRHWSASVNSYGLAMMTGSAIQGFNLATNMPGSNHWVFEVSVNEEPPYPTAPITLLAELAIWPYFPNEPVPLYVAPGYEIPGYGTDAGGAFFHPSSGNWERPVAVINGPAPVEVDVQSWGQLKLLFR